MRKVAKNHQLYEAYTNEEMMQSQHEEMYQLKPKAEVNLKPIKSTNINMVSKSKNSTQEVNNNVIQINLKMCFPPSQQNHFQNTTVKIYQDGKKGSQQTFVKQEKLTDQIMSKKKSMPEIGRAQPQNARPNIPHPNRDKVQQVHQGPVTQDLEERSFQRSQSTVQEQKQTNLLAFNQPTKVPIKNFRHILNKSKNTGDRKPMKPEDLQFKKQNTLHTVNNRVQERSSELLDLESGEQRLKDLQFSKSEAKRDSHAEKQSTSSGKQDKRASLKNTGHRLENEDDDSIFLDTRNQKFEPAPKGGASAMGRIIQVKSENSRDKVEILKFNDTAKEVAADRTAEQLSQQVDSEHI